MKFRRTSGIWIQIVHITKHYVSKNFNNPVHNTIGSQRSSGQAVNLLQYAQVGFSITASSDGTGVGGPGVSQE